MEKELALISSVLTMLDHPPEAGLPRAFVGLDGYIDKIQHPVQTQTERGATYFPSLEAFGERIVRASHQSAQIELFTQEIKAGGNAPIMAHALGCLGIKTLCLGTLGVPNINPVFASMNGNCEVLSIGAAAETNALEFGDGKLILSELSTFDKIDWEYVKENAGLNKLKKNLHDAQLIALVGWCNLPHATDIWKGFLNDIVSKSDPTSRHFFFDLADPSKRSDGQIAEVLDVINAYAAHGTVTLGLNENETHKIYEAIKRINGGKATEKALQDRAQAVFDHLSIERLLVHPIDCCYGFRRGEEPAFLAGRQVKQPKVSTGGGDNFNAGFYFADLQGFSLSQSMIIAMATSGAYVQNGQSPDREALRQYLQRWQSEITG